MAEYVRSPEQELLKSTRQETKTILIARYGMLECGKNFKGSSNPNCSACHCTDDESHRMNYCRLWRSINLFDETNKLDFNLVYSHDINILRTIIPKIEQVWNTKNAHGTMNTQ